ncbi:C_GCAxxG_C_C family protein [Acetivibrio thermocellus ATCC 27405]|uniref:C_GCAxxG_C_C family protein n=1 Tax=Acetivibrio thermocellus (strain ATCC 27405 / DSM 1237 / JCM 9322 / NBRC 103400 / NCIMB 10682 / NRRL B-4536 / VPI 7372) TaxID=203119 RepID=A3DFA1_ACET2|nr:C_GCAxxG_C_C family protein [Acetivibrio thermocellus ATCC 27405]
MLCSLVYNSSMEQLEDRGQNGGIFLNGKSERAVELFKEGYNCSQAVLAAYCEDVGIDMKTALMIASPFGGGIGRLREVCGAASAMFMIAGLKYGYVDPKDMNAKKEHYELVQKLVERFKEENGSIICRELLGLNVVHDKPEPEKRTEGYYKKRPCAEIVRSAAEIVDELLKT